MPIRRLHKKPAVIVVDPTDNTTYYLEPKQEEKSDKSKKKRQKEEEEKQERIAKYLQAKAAQNPNYEAEQAARKQRQAALQAELDSLLAIDYTIENVEYGPQPLVWIDEPIYESTDELSQNLVVSADRVIPQDMTMDVTNNNIFFYFDMVNGRPQQLRLHAQYYADDPLNINKVRFVINGFDYYFTPAELPKTGKDGPRMYWETIDEKLSATDKDLIYALSHGSWARVIYMGADGFSHVKKLTEAQIKDFYSVLSLYLKMGGRI